MIVEYGTIATGFEHAANAIVTLPGVTWQVLFNMLSPEKTACSAGVPAWATHSANVTPASDGCSVARRSVGALPSVAPPAGGEPLDAWCEHNLSLGTRCVCKRACTLACEGVYSARQLTSKTVRGLLKTACHQTCVYHDLVPGASTCRVPQWMPEVK